jgi:uncharacterized membrane protein AbrB (regulator of aidB expression)
MNNTPIDETEAAAPSWLGRVLAFQRLPRVATLMFAAAVVATFLAGLTGGLLARLIGLPLPCTLAGMGEMVLTGKVSGLDAPVIAGFQMVRIIGVLCALLPAFRTHNCRCRRARLKHH